MSTSRELSPVQARALDALDQLVRDGEHGSALAELVAIPSVTGTAAEGEAQHWVSRRCERFGLEVDLWSMDLAELTAMPDFPGAEAPRDEAWGLVAQTPLSGAEDSRRTLVLQGHVDVVPPGDPDAWQGSDPFTPRVIDGVLHGRGACDMKAGVVANLLTVQALHDAGVEPAARLALHSVVGEEDGGLGAFGTLQRGYRGDACVITEPTSRAVITANGGALTFTLTVRGEAAHGSTRYFGVSALEKFAVVHDALRDLETERNESVDPLMVEYPIAYPLMVGRIEAGDWSSTVPDRLVAEGRYGVMLGEQVEDAQQVFEQRVLEACAGDPWLSDHPVSVEWTGGRFAPGRISAGHPFVRQVQDAYATATGAGLPREHGAPYGSDLRLYNAAGVPALHLGPGEVRYAHSPREQVRLAEIADVARALVLLALTFEGRDTA